MYTPELTSLINDAYNRQLFADDNMLVGEHIGLPEQQEQQVDFARMKSEALAAARQAVWESLELRD